MFPGPQSSLKISELSPGDVCAFKLRAQTEGIWSQWSEMLTFYTKPSTPEIRQVSGKIRIENASRKCQKFTSEIFKTKKNIQSDLRGGMSNLEFWGLDFANFWVCSIPYANWGWLI